MKKHHHPEHGMFFFQKKSPPHGWNILQRSHTNSPRFYIIASQDNFFRRDERDVPPVPRLDEECNSAVCRTREQEPIYYFDLFRRVVN